jgi:hypothetical protein
MEGGMSEGGDVELAATHQTEDHDRQYLKRHTALMCFEGLSRTSW